MIPASDRTVTKTDNYFEPESEAKPKKAPRPVERELLLFAQRAAGLIAETLKVAKRRVKTPRSGDDALSARRALLYYLQGKNYPIWMLAQIFELDRGTLTADLQFIQRVVADDEDFDAMMDDLIEGTDHLMRVNPRAFIDVCLAELEADRKAAQALETIRQETRRHERAVEKASPPDSVLRACEGLPESLRQKVLEKWSRTPQRAA